MTFLKTAAIACSILALGAGAASAQTGAMMKNDSMAAKPMEKPMAKMSAGDTKMMKSCMAMGEAMAMKDKGCMKLAKAHPEMMKSGGAMSSGAMSSGGVMAKH